MTTECVDGSVFLDVRLTATLRTSPCSWCALFVVIVPRTSNTGITVAGTAGGSSIVVYGYMFCRTHQCQLLNRMPGALLLVACCC